MLAATIVAIFPALDNFFGAVTAKLSRPQRRHFYAYLLALTISSGLRKTISAAARTVPGRWPCPAAATWATRASCGPKS